MNNRPIEVSSELRRAIHTAEIATEAFRQAGQNERASKLEEYLQNARSLRFSVGVVAQAKRGKSTLINGLLGRKDDALAPVDRFPATNVVSCFANGHKEHARVLFDGDEEKAPGKTIAIEDIRQYACEEHNPDNRKGVKVIEVVGPFPLLGEDVVLVDTPGADNALTRVHDIVLLQFLPKLDAVIFLVTADEPLVAFEVELLKQIRKNDVGKVIFAINKVDKVDAEELQQGIQHNRKILEHIGLGDAPVFEISAKAFHKTGEDSGTERLIRALGETISEGRAGIIAKRLAAITESYIQEAATEIQTALESSKLTIEEIEEKRSQLDEIRRNLDGNRDATERKFRSSWRAAFDECEGALAPLQQQMIQEYTELVESASATKLNELGNMIHTDVVKRLDELLYPHAETLSKSLAAATKELQVDVLKSMGISPRDATAILTRKQGLADAAGTFLAGVPSLAGAVVIGTLPGLVASAIVASAPAVVVATWNPFTWIMAGATGAAAAGASATAVAVGAILSPLALFGTPLLVGYAGLRIFSAWKHKVGQARNELSIAVKDLIIGSIDETRRNLNLAKANDEKVVDEFRESIRAKISETRNQLDDLEKNRPTAERLSGLKQASLLIGELIPPATLPESKAGPGTGERLFP